MRFPTMQYVRPAKAQTSLRIGSEPLLVTCYIKLLIEQHLEFLRLKGDCTGSSESTLVKTPHYWKSHVTAHFYFGYGGHFVQQRANLSWSKAL